MTMKKRIEHVISKMAVVDHNHWDGWFLSNPEEMAEAILTAMHKPTADMVEALIPPNDYGGHPQNTEAADTRTRSRITWQKMIDVELGAFN